MWGQWGNWGNWGGGREGAVWRWGTSVKLRSSVATPTAPFPRLDPGLDERVPAGLLPRAELPPPMCRGPVALGVDTDEDEEELGPAGAASRIIAS